MFVIKRNQVVVTALAVMIAAAGYLNYTGRLFGTEKDDTTQTSADLTNQEFLKKIRRPDQRIF